MNHQNENRNHRRCIGMSFIFAAQTTLYNAGFKNSATFLRAPCCFNRPQSGPGQGFRDIEISRNIAKLRLAAGVHPQPENDPRPLPAGPFYRNLKPPISCISDMGRQSALENKSLLICPSTLKTPLRLTCSSMRAHAPMTLVLDRASHRPVCMIRPPPPYLLKEAYSSPGTASTLMSDADSPFLHHGLLSEDLSLG